MFWTRADIFWLGLIKVVFITAMVFFLSASPAGAGAPKSKKEDGKGGKAEDTEQVAPLDPHMVFMPALVVPVVEQGELLFYYYVGVQLRVQKVGIGRAHV